MASDKCISEIDGGPQTIGKSLYGEIEKGLKLDPNAVAIIAKHQGSDHLAELTGASSKAQDETNHLVWSHSQLSTAGIKLALGLQDCGIQPGSTVFMLTPNRVECPLILLTSTLLRFTLVPLDPGALTPARSEELANLLSLLKPDAIIIEKEADSSHVDSLLGSLNPTLKVFLDKSSSGVPSSGWDVFIDVATKAKHDSPREHSLLEEARKPDLDRIASIFFTSGTSSGKPKGCPRSVESQLGMMNSRFMRKHWVQYSRFQVTTPFFRVISSLTMSSWATGGAIVMPGSSFNAKAVLDTIERDQVNLVIGIPALLKLMLSDPTFRGRDLQSVEVVYLGADLITKDLFELASAAFPDANVQIAHGMTEGASLISWPFDSSKSDDIPFYGEIGPVGEVAQGVRIRVQDMESGRTVKRGSIGELQFCSQNVIKHYLNHEHEENFYEDNVGRWFKTGDLAMMNDDGLIYILGRVKDRIKRSGIPITPAALVTCIEKFTGLETVVIGVPHPIYGHEPFAVVSDYGGKTEEQIMKQVLDLFGKDYALGGVASLHQLGLETFPLNATGKIEKFELLKRVEQLKKPS